MNDTPLLDMTVKITYRKINTVLYTLVFVLGLLFSVPNLISGIFFGISLLVSDEAAFSPLLMVFLLYFLLIPLPVFIFVTRLFFSETVNRYMFYDDKLTVIPKGQNEENIPWSDIIEVKENYKCYMIYKSKRTAYIIPKNELGDITADEFSDVIIRVTNMRIQKM